MKYQLNWPAIIVLAVTLVLGVIGVMAVCREIPENSHDIVLAIVSGLVGAISMKAADTAMKPVETQTPKPSEPPAPAVRDGA